MKISPALLLLTVTILFNSACSKRAEWDVRNFGAKPDGTSINTTAIQAAIDAANTAGGGSVIVAEGAYVTGTILLKDNVTFKLTGTDDRPERQIEP